MKKLFITIITLSFISSAAIAADCKPEILNLKMDEETIRDKKVVYRCEMANKEVCYYKDITAGPISCFKKNY